MASAGPNSPGSGTSDGTIGDTDWSNPSNIMASDNSYATVSLDGGSGETTSYLVAGDMGFSIPTGATIDGILVEWECKKNDFLESVVDNESRLFLSDAIAGDDKASATEWALTDTYRSYGGSSDTWGLTPTAEQINSSGGFGAAISAVAVGPPTAASVDHCRMTVYYTEAGGGGTSGTQTRVTRSRRSANLRM